MRLGGRRRLALTLKCWVVERAIVDRGLYVVLQTVSLTWRKPEGQRSGRLATERCRFQSFTAKPHCVLCHVDEERTAVCGSGPGRACPIGPGASGRRLVSALHPTWAGTGSRFPGPRIRLLWSHPPCARLARDEAAPSGNTG